MSEADGTPIGFTRTHSLCPRWHWVTRDSGRRCLSGSRELQQSGTYTLVANERDGDATNDYTISLNAVGIIVTPTSGLVTTENGGTAPFTVVLNTTHRRSSPSTSAPTPHQDHVSTAPSPSPPPDWIAQTVTSPVSMTPLVDGDVAYSILTAAAAARQRLQRHRCHDVSLINTDNDAAGITVTPTAGWSPPRTAAPPFTVVLNSSPPPFTIDISAPTPPKARSSPAHVHRRRLDMPRPSPSPVSMTPSSMATSPTPSSPPPPSATTAPTTASMPMMSASPTPTTTPPASPSPPPPGWSPPRTAAPLPSPSSSTPAHRRCHDRHQQRDTTEGTATGALTFSATDWNIAQTVTVTGVDDALVDGDVAYSVLTAAAASDDSAYDGIDADDVSLINTDNDAAGITVKPTTGLVTTENGGTAQFTVVLNSQPTADDTIGISSSDTSEGTADVSSLTFTAANWNVAQTVTVTGVDDAVVDGDVAYSIVTAAALSGDSDYSGLDAADVSLTNTDNDAAGITVTPTTGLVTTENGGTAQFCVVLNSQPTADVTIGISSSDTSDGTAVVSSLTFTAANWDVAQTVTVTGVDDALVDGDVAYSIVTAAAQCGDSDYSGLDADDVSLTNTDNDAAGITVTPPAAWSPPRTAARPPSPWSSTASPPPMSRSASAAATPPRARQICRRSRSRPANWNVAQTVTVTGVDDALVDGDVAYSILTAAAVSGDSDYNGLDADDVSLTNTDNDAAGITVTPTTGLVTTENGGTAPFTVVLNSQPTADVTIGLSSSDPTEGTADVVVADLHGQRTGTWPRPSPSPVSMMPWSMAMSPTRSSPRRRQQRQRIQRRERERCRGHQHRQRRRRHHRHPHLRAGHHRERRHGALHRGPQHPAHSRCHHRPEQYRPHRGNGRCVGP